MRKLLSILFLIAAVNTTAQVKEKTVEVSTKVYDILRIIKQNADFDFIVVPDEMTQIMNGKEVSFIRITDKDYAIRIYPNDDVTIHQKLTGDRYYLSVVNKTIVGYALIFDEDSREIRTRYYEGKKIVHKSRIDKE